MSNGSFPPSEAIVRSSNLSTKKSYVGHDGNKCFSTF